MIGLRTRIQDAQFWIFVVWRIIFFKFGPIYFLKGRQTPLLNSKRLKITKNLIDFNFESEFQFSDFSADRKVFLLIQFLQFEFHFIKNVSIINCS